jgi:hypothetical protein
LIQGRTPWAAYMAALLALTATLLALTASGCGGTVSSATASATATAVPSPTPSPTPTPMPLPGTIAPDAGPDHSDVEAPTSGVLYPWYESPIATAHPIAVMIDDAAGARPQSGLSQADVVYQAPAEGGVARYMAVFATQLPDSIGPIRSSRLYFVAWAEEWNALYVHFWGAPNAMNRLAQIHGKDIYDADGLKWETRYMRRVDYKVAPHNLYSSGAQLQSLAARLGATAPSRESPFTFGDLPAAERGTGGTLVIPYHANTITYRYDPSTNAYPRSVTGQDPQVDYGNEQPIAPRNVVLLYQKTGLLPVEVGQAVKGRLEIAYLGSGKATVYNNGQVVDAIWSKATENSPTLLAYAGGPNEGQPVPFARGQTFIQVVPTGTKVTWTPTGD